LIAWTRGEVIVCVPSGTMFIRIQPSPNVSYR
jgi:hypothetical protein